jgi:DNA-binding NtrC family response regulator
VRVLIALSSTAAIAGSLEDALASRGHQASRVTLESSFDPEAAPFATADLVIADTEVATPLELVDRIATAAPGTEFVLVGPPSASPHPDVIAQLPRPLELDALLAVVDELAGVLDGERLREPVDLVAYETLFAGDSPHTRDLLRKLRLVARSDAAVCVVGDDGSGRSVIARAIHDRSSRRPHPYLAFNCAAYGDDELCSRIFEGSGAAVEVARNGSLFNERIAASGPRTQRGLLAYVEQRKPDQRDVRFIIGMQREKVVDGARAFDSRDLFYRLKVLEIDIPPLKDRARDIDKIVGRMLGRLAHDGSTPAVTTETLRLLERYEFPGNLLELAHALTHAYVLARGEAIQPQHLPMAIRLATAQGEQNRKLDGDLEALDVVARRFERDYLLRVLRSVAGNRGRAAEILGLSRKGLWGKLKAHGISDEHIDDDGTV